MCDCGRDRHSGIVCTHACIATCSLYTACSWSMHVFLCSRVHVVHICACVHLYIISTCVYFCIADFACTHLCKLLLSRFISLSLHLFFSAFGPCFLLPSIAWAGKRGEWGLHTCLSQGPANPLRAHLTDALPALSGSRYRSHHKQVPNPAPIRVHS